MGDRATHQRGLEAENQALALLQAKGYQLYARRLRTPYGEIDLALWKDNLLVLVEVKARRTADASLHAVQPRQQKRIAQAAAHLLSLLQEKGQAPAGVRFDVVAITPFTPPHHLEGAWECESF